ncbi:MAG: Bacterial CdiA-CT RNAse domain, partial [Chloroflexota bacterium]|nr:Bacterial CdiA-CT RNAse domain [Chloroflexota bacterium]
ETAPELIDRLEFDPKPKKVSAFPDRARAQEAVQEAIDRHQDEIATWLHNSDTGERLVRDSTLGETTGAVLTRLAWKNGEKPRTTTMVEFVLQRRRDSPLGFVVLTAYPTLSEPPSK